MKVIKREVSKIELKFHKLFLFKFCPGCEILRSTNEFNNDYTNPTYDKLQGRCRICIKNDGKKRRAKIKEAGGYKPDKSLINKKCIVCKLIKTISNFCLYMYSKDGYFDICRGCTHDKEIENKHERHDYYYKYNYGISVEAANILLKKQYNICKICDNPIEDIIKGNQKRAKIDHAHVVGFNEMSDEDKQQYIRGILCTRCNIGIGTFKDSIELLERAIKYLKEYQDFCQQNNILIQMEDKYLI